MYKLLILVTMSLFWKSLTQDADSFSKTIKNHSDNQKISISISFNNNNNTNFFEENEVDTYYDITPETYAEMQDYLKWQNKLPSYTNSTTKNLDNAFETKQQTALISLLYDKEEQQWFNEEEYEEYDEYEVIEYDIE